MLFHSTLLLNISNNQTATDFFFIVCEKGENVLRNFLSSAPSDLLLILLQVFVCGIIVNLFPEQHSPHELSEKILEFIILLTCVIVINIVIGFLPTKPSAPAQTEDSILQTAENITTKQGVLIHSYTGNVDFSLFPVNPEIEFVMIRLGWYDGVIHLDERFTFNMQKATEYRFPAGIYVEINHIPDEGADLIVEQTHKILMDNNFSIEYPLMFSVNGLFSDYSIQDINQISCDLVECSREAGYQSLIYVSYANLSALIDNCNIAFPVCIKYQDKGKPPITCDYAMWDYTCRSKNIAAISENTAIRLIFYPSLL